jgi:hypothetical protein
MNATFEATISIKLKSTEARALLSHIEDPENTEEGSWNAGVVETFAKALKLNLDKVKMDE